MTHKVKQDQLFTGDVTFTGKVDMSDASEDLVVDEIINSANSDIPIKTGVTAVKQFAVKHVTGTIVNNLAAKGAIATSPAELIAEGSDTNIDVKLTPKGTGIVDVSGTVKTTEVHSGADSDVVLATGATKVSQVNVKHVASAVNDLDLKGSATGNPVEVAASGTDTDVDIALTPKGAGVLSTAAAAKSDVGFHANKTGVTVTADGLTTGLIPAYSGVVEITSDDANKIATLPALVAGDVGMRIIIITGGTGCELRTPASSTATINNVNCDGTNEAALLASSSYECIGVAADKWILRGWDNLGADIAAIVPDAA